MHFFRYSRTIYGLSCSVCGYNDTIVLCLHALIGWNSIMFAQFDWTTSLHYLLLAELVLYYQASYNVHGGFLIYAVLPVHSYSLCLTPLQVSLPSITTTFVALAFFNLACLTSTSTLLLSYFKSITPFFVCKWHSNMTVVHLLSRPFQELKKHAKCRGCWLPMQLTKVHLYIACRTSSNLL